jgi:hypothetical protein
MTSQVSLRIPEDTTGAMRAFHDEGIAMALEQAALVNFERDGELVPVLMVFNTESRAMDSISLAGLPEDQEAKAIALEAVRVWVGRHNADLTWMVAEAWTVTYPADVGKDNLLAAYASGDIQRPADSPDREEIVIISVETREQSLIVKYTIDRSGPTPALVDRDVSLTNLKDVSGKMAQWLVDADRN